METIHARHVVLGAGAMGTATAYHLAKRGEPVVLVEQFSIGHQRGSSHGAARITRHSYADVNYARLMIDAFRAWRELEADAGQNLFLRTGGVSLCPPEVDYVAQVVASLEAVGVPHRRMTGAELGRSFPAFQVPGETDAVFEPDAGMLAAARIVRVQVELAREFGGDRTLVLENTPVRRIDFEATKPTLLTDSSRIIAERLIITAGAWTRFLLPQLSVALIPTRQQVLYFRPADAPSFMPGRFPVFIFMGVGEGNAFYGMPSHDGLGVKVARHAGPETDPDQPDPLVGDAYREGVRAFLRGCLPALADAPIDLTEVCLYTMSPDEHFRLGLLPGHSETILASPCSGHGFKFSCLIGSILADLATHQSPPPLPDTWSPGI